MNTNIFKLLSGSLFLFIFQTLFAQNHQLLKNTINENTSFSNAESDSIRISFVKNDFMVNEIAGEFGDNQYNLTSATNILGNTLFVWTDERNFSPEIVMQIIDSTGNRIGDNQTISLPLHSWNNYSDVATNSKGDFIATWANQNNELVVQKISKNGELDGKNLVFPTYGSQIYYPNIALADNGYFMITWFTGVISAKLFNQFGEPITEEIIVNYQARQISSRYPGKRIAVDKGGDFAIVWSSHFSKSEIYLQLINIKGELVFNNIMLSLNLTPGNKYSPKITNLNLGNFLLIWENEGHTTTALFNTLSPQNSKIIELYNSSAPISVSSDKDKLFYIMFGDNSQIYYQKINSEGILVEKYIPINYDNSKITSIYNSGMPDVVNNSFIIGINASVLYDQNTYFSKVLINNNGEASELIRLNDDTFSSPQQKPEVTYNNKGESIIIWKDLRNGYQDIYAQIYDDKYAPKEKNLHINSDEIFRSLSSKQVKSLSNGNFVIAYSGSENFSSDKIYLSLINNNGLELVTSIKVSEGVPYENFNVELGINKEDDILVSWFGSNYAFYRIYDNNLSPLTSEKSIKLRNDYFINNPIDVSIDDEFNIFMVWGEQSKTDYNATKKVLGLFYDVMDEKNSSPFLIDSTQNSFNNISCKNDGKDYIVAYNDENNIKINREYKENGKLYTFSESYFWYYDHKFEIMEFLNKKALLTLRNGLKVNVLFINDNVNQTESVVLHNYDYIYNTAEKYNASYSTSLYNRNLLFVYESNINGGTSSDIWAKVAHIENLNFDKELFLKPTNSDYLFTNYPNPFNFSTTIIYQIVAASNIKISIFDILGREIKVLVNEPKNKGTYKVEFNSGGLASGIYFYKLEAFDTKVNKMILLK